MYRSTSRASRVLNNDIDCVMDLSKQVQPHGFYHHNCYTLDRKTSCSLLDLMLSCCYSCWFEMLLLRSARPWFDVACCSCCAHALKLVTLLFAHTLRQGQRLSQYGRKVFVLHLAFDPFALSINSSYRITFGLCAVSVSHSYLS